MPACVRASKAAEIAPAGAIPYTSLMDDGIFILGKLVWGIVEPGTLLLLFLLVGFLGLVRGYRRAGMILLGAGLAAAAAIAVLPLGDWLLRPLEQRYSMPRPMPDTIAGILLLGGGLDPALSATHGQPMLTGASDRIIATALLARHYPEGPILLLGGSGRMRDQGPREAPEVAALLGRLGVDPQRLKIDDTSRTTRENAAIAAALGGSPGSAGAPWLLVTSAWHMPRSMASFADHGWHIRAYPTDYLTDPADNRWFPGLTEGLSGLGLAMKEWLGLVAYAMLERL